MKTLLAENSKLGLLILAVALSGTSWAGVDAGVTDNDVRVARAKSDLGNLVNLLKVFRAKFERYPTTSEGLAVLVKEQILAKVPADPWGTPYEYRNVDGKAFCLSFGPDQKQGGTGGDVDLVSVELNSAR
jgi:Type II secretion system (T2SS), protein G